MESEKVKEIKKVLECMSGVCKDDRTFTCYSCVISQNFTPERAFKEALTLVNELESENERLKGEKQILEDKDTLLAKVGELSRENQQLKDRIAELEEYIKGNAQDAKAFVNGWHKDLETELKQFAERLKGKAIRRQEFIGELAIDDVEYVKVKDIDKTLKECLGK